MYVGAMCNVMDVLRNTGIDWTVDIKRFHYVRIVDMLSVGCAANYRNHAENIR